MMLMMMMINIHGSLEESNTLMCLTGLLTIYQKVEVVTATQSFLKSLYFQFCCLYTLSVVQ